MDRQKVYETSIPRASDLLNTNKNVMIALAKLAESVLGTSTLVDGLACIPTTPASMGVIVGGGSIYSQAQVDATDYGSIPADTTDQVVKQGIVIPTTPFAIAAPPTTGQSVVYLIQAAFQEVDGGNTVLPYYNSANPAVPFSGPANSGTANSTVRQGKCLLSLKAGTAAATGTQAAPSPDAGFVGLWAITVANGATTITSGNIAQAAGAPFIGDKLTAKLGQSAADARYIQIGGAIKSVKRQTFTTNATYTPSAGMAYCVVRAWGGGGGGGGVANSSSVGAAGGGGAGGFSEVLLAAAAVGASRAVTMGAAGAGGAAGNNAGGNGGDTSLGTLCVAKGGSGGNGAAANTSATGGNGGVAGTGDIAGVGQNGHSGIAVINGFGGAGGSGSLGSGGNEQPAQTSGNAATGYGSGGGGGLSTSSVGNVGGGAGTQGFLVVTEYCTQ